VPQARTVCTKSTAYDLNVQLQSNAIYIKTC